MGKFLRVLVFFILMLSIAALVLGCMLYVKRELLKGRTERLEKALIALGPFFEDVEPTAPQEEPYPARDTSPCQAQALPEPERSVFWKTYRRELEEATQTMVDLKAKERNSRRTTSSTPSTRKSCWMNTGANGPTAPPPCTTS